MRRWPGIYRNLSYALVMALMLAGGILYLTHMPGNSWSGVLPPLTMEQARLQIVAENTSRC